MSAGRIFATCVATLAVLIAAIYALKNPTAFVVIVAVTIWLVSVAVALIVCALYGETKQQLADTDRKVETLRDALMAADQENAILSGRLEDVAPFPRLHAVAPLPVADDITPIRDRVLIDHWIEDVQAWGEDEER